MRFETRNGDVVVTMTAVEALDLVGVLTDTPPSNEQLHRRVDVAYSLSRAADHAEQQRAQIVRMFSATNPPQDLMAHDSNRDQRGTSPMDGADNAS